MLEEGHRVTIVSHQAERLAELLAELDIFVPVTTAISEPPVPGTPKLVQGCPGRGMDAEGRRQGENPGPLHRQGDIRVCEAEAGVEAQASAEGSLCF